MGAFFVSGCSDGVEWRLQNAFDTFKAVFMNKRDIEKMYLGQKSKNRNKKSTFEGDLNLSGTKKCFLRTKTV